MRFLITNDDGYDAPGLASLYRALQPFGEVVVAAPAEQHSSKGHAVVAHLEVKVERRELEPFGSVFVVHGTPADCIRIATRYLFEEKPDFVVSGINPGANLGIDANYSGTIAAAREAAILGFPGIAISQYMQSHIPLVWDSVTQLATSTLAEIFELPLPERELWNINFPATPVGEEPKPLALAPLCTLPHDAAYEVSTSDGSEFYRLCGRYQDRGVTPGSDVEKVFRRSCHGDANGARSDFAFVSVGEFLTDACR